MDVAPRPDGPRQARISNEVLEERLTQYFSRTTEAFEQINQRLDRWDSRLERGETTLSVTQERLRDHEHLLHHPETTKKLGTMESTISAMQQEIIKLNHISEIEKSVITLASKVDVIGNDVRTLQEEALTDRAREQGRGQLLTSFDKGFIKFVLAASFISTIVAILTNTGIVK